MPANHVFEVEYSKSGRAGCKHCKAKIDKDVVRFGHKTVAQEAADAPEDAGARAMSHAMESTKWYHVECFSSMKGKAWFRKNLPESASSCVGIDALQENDQETVKKTFATCRGEGVEDTPSKKRAASSDDGSAQKQPRLDEAATATPGTLQGVLTDDELKAFEVAKAEFSSKNKGQLEAMLKLNGLPKAGAKPELVDRAAECKALGVPPACPTCEKSKLKFSRVAGTFSCGGFFDEDAGRFKRCKGPSADFQAVRVPWQVHTF